MTKLYILNGPEMGESFDLKVDAPTYVGRSHDNDIQISDRTVSRRHLKIIMRGQKYFVTDLDSRNGTFINGAYIGPGIEVALKEGVPVAIGMSVICLGEGCIEQLMPFLDSIGLTRETGEQSGIFSENRERTNQKKLELLYKVSEVLTENLSLTETLKKILDHIFELLKRIDRGAFILLDPETKEIREIIYRSKKPGDDTPMVYCQDVVNRVIGDGKAVAISDARDEVEDELAVTLKLLKIGSVMCVPLISGSQIMGVIYVDSLEQPYGFQKEDLFFFMDLCRRTALAVENAQLASDLS
ncbi:MAG: FHA domain-containing protein [Desulfobacteraceae bacterium]|jgi:pSer/pThr/pTyr-binding forkhead associated (FHA) protein